MVTLETARMNPRTEQPWLDTEAASHTMRVYRMSFKSTVQPEPLPAIWRLTFCGALLFLAAIVATAAIVAFGG